MKIEHTPEWAHPLVQSTADILGMSDGDELEHIQSAADILIDCGLYNEQTLTALLIDGSDEAAEYLMPMSEDFHKAAAEMVETFFLAECRGGNALFAAKNKAPLYARMAHLIADSDDDFGWAFGVSQESDGKKTTEEIKEEELCATGHSLWRMAERMEMSRFWTEIPEKMFEAFCAALDTVAKRLKDDKVLITALEFMSDSLKKEADKDFRPEIRRHEGRSGKPISYGCN